MIIKKANKTNRSQIQALMNDLNLYRKKIFSPHNQDFHKRITPYPPLKDKDFAQEFIFIAIDDSGAIVGFIQGNIAQRKNHKLNKLGYINELYVKKDARSKGVAKNLFLALESEFKKQGCNHITTHTDFENKLAQRFYLGAGMNKATIEFWKKL